MAAVAALLALAASPAYGQPAGVAHSIELTGTVDPATEGWLRQALADARDEGARLVVVRLDTPGGLDASMRAMVRDILAAPIPVVVYVAPNGARAASAGLFLTQAADVAAMAPQTNIGAATPIALGPGEEDEVLGRKVRNDAAAYVRALAEGHGRDAELAERMVRESTSVTAARAEQARLVDVVAPNERQLLERLDGFRVQGPKAQVLETSRLSVERRDTPLRFEAMQALVNPTVAVLLLMGGGLLILLEVMSPGGVVAGALGSVALVVGLFGTAQLPVTAAGIILLVLALGLLGAETQVASGGALGGAGVVALVAGGLLLFDTGSEALRVSVPAVVGAGVVLGTLVMLAGRKAIAARRDIPVTGTAELVGEIGTVRAPLDPVGQIFVKGALWRARPTDDEAPAGVGERARVQAVDGLTLKVRAASEGTDTNEGSRT